MKILLCAVNSKYIHSNLAVRLLHACAAAPGIEIREFTINQPSAEVLAELYCEHPDVLLFSCYIWNWEFIRALLQDIPKVLPDTSVWAGGPEVSYDAEQILRSHPELTGILEGEGEVSFPALVQAYLKHSSADLSGVPGICFRSGEQILRTAAPLPVEMDEVPFIYSEDTLEDLRHKILYYESSRGCPFRCSYCLSGAERKVRFRSISLVLKELSFFLTQRVPQVKFVDRTFNADPKRSLQILNFLLEHDNGCTNFHFEIEGDLLTPEELKVMSRMRPGLIQLEIGVQSTNPDTLNAICRNTDLKRLKENVARIRQMGTVHQHLDLIAGLPEEDYAGFARSFNEVYAMEPDQLQLGFLKVLKGTSLRKHAEAFGIVYQQRAPYEVLSTKWLSYGELLRLKRMEEMVELYYNSRQFTKTLRVLEQEFSAPFTLYERLARYYEEKGYVTNQPSRMYRYEVLLQFACEVNPKREELYREVLTFDLYLREHVKSRPPFTRDLSPYREKIRNLRPDKKWHVEPFYYQVLEKDAYRIAVRFDTPSYLAFSYDQRDPLDHNASVIQL